MFKSAHRQSDNSKRNLIVVRYTMHSKNCFYFYSRQFFVLTFFFLRYFCHFYCAIFISALLYFYYYAICFWVLYNHYTRIVPVAVMSFSCDFLFWIHSITSSSGYITGLLLTLLLFYVCQRFPVSFAVQSIISFRCFC